MNLPAHLLPGMLYQVAPIEGEVGLTVKALPPNVDGIGSVTAPDAFIVVGRRPHLDRVVGLDRVEDIICTQPKRDLDNPINIKM